MTKLIKYNPILVKKIKKNTHDKMSKYNYKYM